MLRNRRPWKKHFPGGGVALARSAKALDSLSCEGDEQIGVKSLGAPNRRSHCADSARCGEEGAIVLGNVLDSRTSTSLQRVQR